MAAPRISVEDIGAYDIAQDPDTPGQWVVSVGGEVEVTGSFASLECLAFNVLALVSGERLDVYRQLGSSERLDTGRQIGGET